MTDATKPTGERPFLDRYFGLTESGTDVRRIQLLMGHRSLSTTAKYLKVATSTVCATSSPFDLLPHPELLPPQPPPPAYF